MSDPRRSRPSTTVLLQALEGTQSHAQKVQAVRMALLEVPFGSATEAYIEFARQTLLSLSFAGLRPVINGTGVLLHTGLGRARLAPYVAAAVANAASSPVLLEHDLDSGKRGDRQDHVRELLRELTGCEDAFVVNNCAGALMLVLSSVVAPGRLVISRGQLIEIGGSYRLPDVIRASGAKRDEVGCTNKTRIEDYIEATVSTTKAWLRCHKSNFAVTGFCEEPSVAELVQARPEGLMVIDDLGGGCLLDTTTFGLPRETTLKDSVRAGSDLVLASGDKLLGGTQCGLILGRKELIAKLRKHPLARALRIDKLSLAGLVATLELYRDKRESEIPLWRALADSASDRRVRAEHIASRLGGEVRPNQAAIGGGAMPGAIIESYAAVFPATMRTRFERRTLPIIGFQRDGRFWIDVIALEPAEIEEILTLSE